MNYSVPSPIQFRAWNHAERVMLDTGCLHQLAFNRLTVNEAHALTEPWEALLSKVVTQQHLYTLMLWTGILDRHGRKVFHGDVLRLHQKHCDHHFIHTVACYWDATRAGFSFCTGPLREPPLEGGIFIQMLALKPNTPNEDLLVLGNIFEDPNLFQNGPQIVFGYPS